MENIPDTPEGIILESLLEGMNQYYSAELSQKVKRGMKETRLKGLYQGGTLPYGYKLDGRKVAIDEQQAKHVLFMYEQYSKGVFVKDIIRALTENGVSHKGKPFAKNTVYGILSNEKYSGSYKKGDEIVDNIYPQIVPTELFTIVRQKVTANKFGKSCVKTVFLLKNKVKCGYCGENINAESGTAKNGTKKYYYKCNGRKNRKNNCKKTANTLFTPNFVYELIQSCYTVKNPEEIRRTFEEWNQYINFRKYYPQRHFRRICFKLYHRIVKRPKANRIRCADGYEKARRIDKNEQQFSHS